jgi:hypothetical protein
LQSGMPRLSVRIYNYPMECLAEAALADDQSDDRVVRSVVAPALGRFASAVGMHCDRPLTTAPRRALPAWRVQRPPTAPMRGVALRLGGVVSCGCWRADAAVSYAERPKPPGKGRRGLDADDPDILDAIRRRHRPLPEILREAVRRGYAGRPAGLRRFGRPSRAAGSILRGRE